MNQENETNPLMLDWYAAVYIDIWSMGGQVVKNSETPKKIVARLTQGPPSSIIAADVSFDFGLDQDIRSSRSFVYMTLIIIGMNQWFLYLI
jgi:hypothetical protein